MLALDMEEARGVWQEDYEGEGGGGGREEVADLLDELMREKGPMLAEYLSMEVGVLRHI